jgi:hypothetical protein
LATRKVETKADVKRAKEDYLKKLIAWLYNLFKSALSILSIFFIDKVSDKINYVRHTGKEISA